MIKKGGKTGGNLAVFKARRASAFDLRPVGYFETGNFLRGSLAEFAPFLKAILALLRMRARLRKHRVLRTPNNFLCGSPTRFIREKFFA